MTNDADAPGARQHANWSPYVRVVRCDAPTTTGGDGDDDDVRELVVGALAANEIYGVRRVTDDGTLTHAHRIITVVRYSRWRGNRT